MSSEEEATAANVLSQMSQIQQISCETIEATVINVGHHCDVETTATQGSWNFCFFFHSVCKCVLTHSLTNPYCVIPEDMHTPTKVHGYLVSTSLPLGFPIQLHTFPLKMWLLGSPTPWDFPKTILGVDMDIF